MKQNVNSVRCFVFIYFFMARKSLQVSAYIIKDIYLELKTKLTVVILLPYSE